MAVKFALFSTDKGSSIDPWSLSPQPATMIDLGEDPIFGEYDPEAGSSGRGSRIATFGGAVIQDFGFFDEDGTIRLSVENSPIADTVIAALKAACATADGTYYFTDSVRCWEVKFARPNGFRYWRNLFFLSSANEDVFSYELLLNVTDLKIDGE